jgi:hypothetical protein
VILEQLMKAHMVMSHLVEFLENIENLPNEVSFLLEGDKRVIAGTILCKILG